MADIADVTEWLLDSDPALRWQVERDLLGEPESVWQATRARLATEGMGARLLALQDEDGQWAGGAFFPADFDFEGPEAAPGAGQPWTATTWSLNSLREWGLDASALEGTAEKIAANSRWEYDDLPYWGGEVDCCINAFTLANGTWLGADVSSLRQWFVDHQMDEGGWNCEWVEGSTRASVYSTLSSIDGILWYEKATGGTPELTAARKKAQEYLLERRILYKVTTGEPVRPGVELLAYPQRSKYNVLHAVNYFRDASLYDGVEPDPRLAEAVEVIRRQRQPDGTWLQGYRYPGRVWFEQDVPVGEPSKWVTFLALRALDWWDSAAPGVES
ncbi:squalene cyclase [Microbacterium sp.]|uniref:squalene cyclase n=1 Tax=Microbacterium sp. TaxID=51671 RepID=UPI002D79FF18|nr:squalene cyclase [Microbacterium sp.]HET6301176.1 squalene cyclase [Microbacterium sp.]